MHSSVFRHPESSQGSYQPPVDREALDELFSLTYEELRRLAAAVSRRECGSTLNPTALVNETWLKLAKAKGGIPDSPLHFKRIAARAMRQLLVEAARRRGAQKRNWGWEVSLLLADDLFGVNISSGAELLTLSDALDRLSAISQRQAGIVELRFFGGLDVSETAAALAISEATVMRDWRIARAWLARELRQLH